MMFGTFTDGAYGSAMKLALVMLCIGAAAFLLRVLAALVEESRFPQTAGEGSIMQNSILAASGG